MSSSIYILCGFVAGTVFDGFVHVVDFGQAQNSEVL